MSNRIPLAVRSLLLFHNIMEGCAPPFLAHVCGVTYPLQLPQAAWSFVCWWCASGASLPDSYPSTSQRGGVDLLLLFFSHPHHPRHSLHTVWALYLILACLQEHTDSKTSMWTYEYHYRFYGLVLDTVRHIIIRVLVLLISVTDTNIMLNSMPMMRIYFAISHVVSEYLSLNAGSIAVTGCMTSCEHDMALHIWERKTQHDDATHRHSAAVHPVAITKFL